MVRQKNYNTRQKEAILAFLAEHKDSHVTAAQIKESTGIGKTTVYRLLNSLAENNQIRRYSSDGATPARYQFAKTLDDCRSHYHFKCEDCNMFFHIECETLDSLKKHFKDEHSFSVDYSKTILYGTCEKCLNA